MIRKLGTKDEPVSRYALCTVRRNARVRSSKKRETPEFMILRGETRNCFPPARISKKAE